ncbi:unnamed protein product [Closterium sp. NIES-54]
MPVMATITVVAASIGRKQQPLPHPDTLSPQQLREWVIHRGRSGPGAWDYLHVGGTGQQRQSRCQETLLPQQLREWSHHLLVPLPPTSAPLQTLHMDVWGPARVSGTDKERYFLLVVDNYTCYTTIFPLRSKADVSGVLIPWIRATRHQLRERFWLDFPVLRLHSNRGGEFSSGLLADLCRDEGIHKTFTLTASPQQNGIAKRRIGLIMDVARISMIHAAAPHFLWPFAIRYAAHQLNLWPCVSLPKTSPTLRWTGEVGNASAFLGPAPSDVSQVDPPPLVEPLEISFDSSDPAEGGDLPADDTTTTPVDTGAAGGGDTGGEDARGAKTGGAESGGVEIGGTVSTDRPVSATATSWLPLPSHAPHNDVTESLIERREPETCASTPVCARRVTSPRPPAVLGIYVMTLRPSSFPQCVPLPSPPTSSLRDSPDPPSDLARAASPTVTRLLATVITGPKSESTAAFALVTELVDFAARRRLDYVASLVTESKSVCLPPLGGELALGNDVLEDMQFELECLATALPHFASMLLCPEGDSDAPDIPTPRPYAQEIAGEYSSQWQTVMDAEMASWKSTCTYIDAFPPPGANIGVNFFQTFSPTPKVTTRWVLLHVEAHRDYDLHSLDFSIAFLQGSLHKEIWLHCPSGFTGTTLAALWFAPSSADPSLFLRTDTSLQLFYVLVYVDDLVFATADTEALALVKAEVQERHTCTDLGDLRSYLGLQITQDRARRTITLNQSHMVSQAMLALCHEKRLEHRTKHVALCYFLSRELQQRGQLRLSLVASRANTADVFTQALGSENDESTGTRKGTGWGEQEGTRGDHEPSVQVLGRAGRAITVAAAPPALASAATVPAPAAAPAAPPLPSPAVAATAPIVATGTPALPSLAAAVVTPPLLSSTATATEPATALVTPALPSSAAAASAPTAAGWIPALLSPAVAASALAAAVVTPLLSLDAPTEIAATASAAAIAAAVVTPPPLSPGVVVTPPLLSPSAAVTPPLLSPNSPIETATTAAAAAATSVPSQTAPTPPSPNEQDAALVSGNG